MPTFTTRKSNEVPRPILVTKAVRERRLEYEGFITSVGDAVGELELGPDEAVRIVKVQLARAASRLGLNITKWDANGKVYFRKEVRRGRPRKAK